MREAARAMADALARFSAFRKTRRGFDEAAATIRVRAP
jgi:hypothetical protein